MQRLGRVRLPGSFALLALLGLAAAPSARLRAAEPLAVRPSETDPRIRAFDEPHLAWLPQGTPRGQLLLYLPGTGGAPEKNKSHAFLETAAGLGYHVVALMYPDNFASQKKCSESDDPEAYMKFRNAILRGGVEFGRHVIAPQDSIENRFEKLLAYLDRRQPGSGWREYLDGPGGIRWGRVAVSGSSQGGGHAYVLGKNYEVARVVMLASPKDYSFRFRAPARGFDGHTKTPLSRFFAYNHVRDNGNGCTHEQQRAILAQIGLDRLGVADADTAAPPFQHARVLYTNADLGSSNAFHGSILKKGLGANAAVWKYVLTEAVE